MAPRMRGTNKRRPSTTRGSLLPEFTKRSIKAECRFDEQPNRMTEWTLNLLTSLGLLNILVPAAFSYYPRVVALFYQNLTQIHDEPLTLASTVDGFQVVISRTTVAQALAIPEERPIDSTYAEPGDIDEDYMFEKLQVRGKRIERKIDHVNLPQDLWFLSYVLYKNVVVLGHRTERRRPALDLLWYAYNATWFTPVPIIIDSMLAIANMCRLKTKNGAKQFLAYPFLITKLLLDQGFEFDENEPSSSETDNTDFKKSYNTSVKNIQKTKALSQGASSSTAPQEELHYEVSSDDSDDRPTREEFNSLSDTIDEIQTDVFNNNALLQSLIHIQFPDSEGRIQEEYTRRRRSDSS